MANLETYVPTAKTATAGGKAIAILPLRVRQLPAFAAAIAPAAGMLSERNLLAAVARHGPSLIEAVSIATGEPVDWLGDLLPDEFVALVADVIEVNADFFVRRVNPALHQAEAMLVSLMTRTSGATPSPS